MTTYMRSFLIIGLLLFSGVTVKVLASSPEKGQAGAFTFGNARIEFLSPAIVRLQYSPGGHFVDPPTAVVEPQSARTVQVAAREENGWVVLMTSDMTVRYRKGTGAYAAGNLAVSWNIGAQRGTWSPGDRDSMNLGGIVTMDGVNGNRLPHMPDGVLSRSGYYLLDDSESPLLGPRSRWLTKTREMGNQDWYLIAYGHDYPRALKEFSLLCGKIPMMPRYTLGTWITDLNFEYLPGVENTPTGRYSSDDLMNEITRFRAEGLPLDVLVLDFAWHKFGWQGGYDWSPIFKDPVEFLRGCHRQGVHVGVNDHPKVGGETALSDADSHAKEARRELGGPSRREPHVVIDLRADWKFAIDPTDTGSLASWFGSEFDDSAWRAIDAGRPWQEQGYPGTIGLAWYRKWITVPQMAPKRLYLVLGGAADQYQLFINGKKVTEHISAGNHVYNTMTYTDITDVIDRQKRNLIALRVNAWSTYGGLTALPVEISDGVPQGMLEFTLTDKREADAFMNALHAPLMKQGVDFWWIDGSGPCPVNGLDGQLWTNRLYYLFSEAFTGKRTLIMSRYAGWGSERYPAFITGDTYSEWAMLAYQVGFTGRAGNVLMPFITHDIGGFHGDTLTTEFYCRWLEFGAFSPMLRLHCAHENPTNGNLRMPWVYGREGTQVARRYFNLREELIPYIYTSMREAYDDALPLVRPLYLEQPDLSESYAHPYEYYFGHEFLVSPVVDTGGMAVTYFPPGNWVGYFDGKRFEGERVTRQEYGLEDLPLFVRAGAVLPMQPRSSSCRAALDTLVVQWFGPEAGKCRLYEDDGTSLGYKQGRCAWTSVVCSGDSARGYLIAIGPTRGKYAGQLLRRAYVISLRGFAATHEVRVNGHLLAPGRQGGGWQANSTDGTLEIRIPSLPIRAELQVTFH